MFDGLSQLELKKFHKFEFHNSHSWGKESGIETERESVLCVDVQGSSLIVWVVKLSMAQHVIQLIN